MVRNAELIDSRIIKYTELIAEAENKIQLAQKAANKQISDISHNLGMESIAKSKLSFEKFKTMFAWMGPLMRDFSPYLVLIILILILIGGISSSSSRSQPGRKINTSSGTKVKNALQSLFEKIFPVHIMRKWFNPFGKVDSIKRNMNGGRCDNLAWLQKNDRNEPYGGGLCVKTFDPKPFEWQLDTSKNPDFDKLPAKMQADLTGSKTKVYIPYAKQATFYVPQCSKAYYLDGEKKVVFAQKGSPLLVDNGLSCSLAQRPLGSLHTSKFRLSENATADKRDQVTSCTI